MRGILERIQRGVERVDVRHMMIPGDDALRVLEPEDLGVGREALVQPDVLPAQQADGVAEPLVRRLVGDEGLEPGSSSPVSGVLPTSGISPKIGSVCVSSAKRIGAPTTVPPADSKG